MANHLLISLAYLLLSGALLAGFLVFSILHIDFKFLVRYHLLLKKPSAMTFITFL